MYTLGADGSLIDTELLMERMADPANREEISKVLLQQLAEKRRKKRIAWGVGIAAVAALGVGGWFVYDRYIKE